MPRSNAKLRIVAAPPPCDPRDPEQELANLFRREAALERELRQVRAALDTARKRYAEANQLRANPRMELLRTRFGREQ